MKVYAFDRTHIQRSPFFYHVMTLKKRVEDAPPQDGRRESKCPIAVKTIGSIWQNYFKPMHFCEFPLVKETNQRLQTLSGSTPP
jgi:hypothetical protein